MKESGRFKPCALYELYVEHEMKTCYVRLKIYFQTQKWIIKASQLNIYCFLQLKVLHYQAHQKIFEPSGNSGQVPRIPA